MSDTEFSALQEQIDQSEADTNVLSDNKVEDLVEIANGNIIANEHQMVIGHLALSTGWMWPHERNVNTVMSGPSAGGKSLTQEAVTKALPSKRAYNVTDTSSKGVLDDDRWDKSLYAPLDEWQKVPDEVTELLKSLSGGADSEFRYVRSVSDDDSDSGRTGHEIVKKAKPFSFLSAQHAMDHELSTRLVYLPIDDNVYIRDAIIEKEGGATDISVEGYDKEFIFDTLETERAFREHLRGLDTNIDDDGHRRGAVDAVLPPWVRKSIKPIFDRSRVETNRVAGQVFNLIRASAVVNYDTRRETTVTHEGKELTAYIAEPQDVANIMSARDTLLATTHELTTIKREIIDAIRSHQHFDSNEEGVGVTIDTIRDYLDHSSSLSVPRKQKLREILDELSEQFYVAIHERAGPNGAHLYEFKSMRDIGVPRIKNLGQYMDDGELSECEELSPAVDLDDPYDGVTDPFKDQPFTETVEEMRQEFAQNAVERADRTAELKQQARDDDEGTDDGDLTLGEAMGGDGESSLEYPDDGFESDIHDRLLEHADGSVYDLSVADDAHFIGAVEKGTPVAEADVQGTVLDPDHDFWDRSTKPDDWVTSRAEAESQIEQTVTDLENKGLIEYDLESREVPDGYVAVEVMEV